MGVKTTYVTLTGVRFYAYHGVLPQERRVGGWFTVSLRVGYDFSRAMESDDFSDTVSYAMLYELLKTEMATPSQLLEHVAGRILTAVINAVPQATSADLWLQKDNPPMGADTRGAGVEIHWDSQVEGATPEKGTALKSSNPSARGSGAAGICL